MLGIRVIPCLQLVGRSLVKTVKFGEYDYIGDPVNTVRIFNELEVDELCFLDIRATVERRTPNLQVLREISAECFMPLSYGGAVRDLAVAREILSIGFEKLVINSFAHEDPSFLSRLADHSGSQAVIASLDVKKDLFGRYQVFSHDGTRKGSTDPVQWARRLQDLGAGELLLTSMNRDGTWSGYDVDLIKKITDAVSVPVIANGGAGSVAHIGDAVKRGGASAVAVGSMVVYQSKGMGVLVNFPDATELAAALR
ncbi:MAG TPA: AglZ/HisF2 family acetamidino modification protein [Polyangiaceae bacterium]|jgi:cyclase|nr:AglZ/HisF2 family acetamidino modification protein [Polyangiaceae bacterium]